MNTTKVLVLYQKSPKTNRLLIILGLFIQDNESLDKEMALEYKFEATGLNTKASGLATKLMAKGFFGTLIKICMKASEVKTKQTA